MGRVTPGLPDDELRDRVARATCGYFLHGAHPCGMARERSAGAFGYDVDEVVTTGGTGFGLMALVIAAKREWAPRHEVEEQVRRIVAFLEGADRFRGVFAHFYSGSTGRAFTFSAGDDRADLVETAFLMSGLLTAGAFFAQEAPDLSERINALYAAVEWDAHLRPEDGALMWHRRADGDWGPDGGRGLPIRGWNEALVVFVLAAGSPTHPIPTDPYRRSWAKAPDFRNGKTYDGVTLPLGPEGGGPLFLSQYSFLGLDPNGLFDAYADYGMQVRAHTAVNRLHCERNPHGYRGYGPDCWGLTASDDPSGYVAHSPREDTGVITPTAALSALPYSPTEAMRVLRHLHDDLGERLFDEDLGFVDAFEPGGEWTAESRLAIDQGPIVVGFENHRTGLIWRLFMLRREVQAGLRALGFQSPYLAIA